MLLRFRIDTCTYTSNQTNSKCCFSVACPGFLICGAKGCHHMIMCGFAWICYKVYSCFIISHHFHRIYSDFIKSTWHMQYVIHKICLYHVYYLYWFILIWILNGYWYWNIQSSSSSKASNDSNHAGYMCVGIINRFKSFVFI